jgi:hypothetical protein
MTSALIPLRAAALDYAGRNGWSVFPLWPRSKKPACRRDYKDATTNPATIRRWWLAQDYNIGIATGLISGVWVFDVDGATGAATLGDLETKNGNLPATLISVTSAGPHFGSAQPVRFNQVPVVLAMVAMLGPKTVMSWRRLLFILTGLSIAGVMTPQ